MEAMVNIISGCDTLAILPTAYGKSMIYQLLPPVCSVLEDQPDHPIVIVVSPLKSLIVDQVARANELNDSLGILACSLDDKLDIDSLKSRKFNIIFGIPEAWLLNSSKTILTSKYFRRNIVCIVVDEAHKVAWLVFEMFLKLQLTIQIQSFYFLHENFEANYRCCFLAWLQYVLQYIPWIHLKLNCNLP